MKTIIVLLWKYVICFFELCFASDSPFKTTQTKSSSNHEKKKKQPKINIIRDSYPQQTCTPKMHKNTSCFVLYDQTSLNVYCS